MCNVYCCVYSFVSLTVVYVVVDNQMSQATITPHLNSWELLCDNGISLHSINAFCYYS